MERKADRGDNPAHGFAADSSAKKRVTSLRVRLVISHDDMRKIRFHEDAISRLAVAAEALKTVGNPIRSAEVARIRDEVIADYAKFLAGLAAPATVEALAGRR